MPKKVLSLTLIIIFLLSVTAAAVSLDDFDKELLIRVYNDLDSDDLEYMARLGLNSKDISLILYYYSNSGQKLDEHELRNIARKRGSLEKYHHNFWLPNVIFEDSLIRLRHPRRQRLLPPLDSKNYDRKREYRGGIETVRVRGHNYDYSYYNEARGIEEEIEIKNQKYDYYYRDRNMIEKLSVHYANNRYSYYYEDLNTGRTIEKDGRGRQLSRDTVYNQLKDSYQEETDDKDNGDNGIDISFDIVIDLSDLLN
ncbi:hypothetical protein [Halanaerobium hydrogeniformans]|uniref:Uncharacterized protein n=1 Tax=Halanaerobium hydrogeniformans TaxID=656519 RepID=E4RMB9_HALHG|nr:hypothetical protein [Halanaerobium hydrogeniformans]ADQ14450.1 hypothetical protein Halsa_1006 [Halanaerobium hydrogeniformans]